MASFTRAFLALQLWQRNDHIGVWHSYFPCILWTIDCLLYFKLISLPSWFIMHKKILSWPFAHLRTTGYHVFMYRKENILKASWFRLK